MAFKTAFAGPQRSGSPSASQIANGGLARKRSKRVALEVVALSRIR